SGMHLKAGVDELKLQNSAFGRDFASGYTDTFPLENHSQTILMQELPNGVTRVQLPQSSATRKALAVSSPDGLVKGIKTLWPDSYGRAEIAAAGRALLDQNPGATSGGYSGTYNGVKMFGYVRDGKIMSIYPKWNQ